MSEAAVLLTRAKRATLERLEEFDHLDFSPPLRVLRPAGTWGIYSPGLRKAEPFDGLVIG